MPSPPSPGDRSADRDWWWIFDPRISLRARSALVLGGGAILFTLLVSWLAGRMFQRHLQTQLGPGFETLAFQMSDKLDRHLYERYRTLQFAAEFAPFRTNDIAPAEYRRWTKSLLDASPELAWVGFADGFGRILGAAPGLFENTNVENEPWFRAARDKPYFGTVHELPALARQMPDDESAPRFLNAALPVRDLQGRFIGVLAAELRWSQAREIQLSVLPSAASRRRVGVTVYDAKGEVLLDSGGSGWSEPPEAPAVAGRRGARGSLVEKTMLGTTYLTGYARSVGLREFQGLGWLTVVRQPVDIAFAPVQQLQRSLLIFGGSFAAVLVVATWWYAGRLARRLGGVAAVARRIRAGDVLAVMPSPRSDSEIDRMCGALGDMVEDFRRKEERCGEKSPAATGDDVPLKSRPNPALRELPW